MRYDRGYGPYYGWEYRMENGSHGYDRGYRGPRSGGGRAWVGDRGGYQGGSMGYAVGTSGPLYLDHDAGGPPRDRGFRRPRGYGRDFGGRGGYGGGYRGYGAEYRGYGGDFRNQGYGRRRTFPNEGWPGDYHYPRHPLVGGVWGPMGGWF